MAFGGTMGAAAAMTPVAAMRVPLGSSVPVYVGDTISIPTSDGTGTVRDSIQELIFVPITSGSPVLAAFIGQSVDGSSADAGVLTTASPTGNRHGIPSNFGPGRGNWTFADLYRLRMSIEAVQFAAYASDGGMPFATAIQLSGASPSDVLIFFKNQSAQNIEFLRILLKYDHSIVI